MKLLEKLRALAGGVSVYFSLLCVKDIASLKPVGPPRSFEKKLRRPLVKIWICSLLDLIRFETFLK